MLSVMSGSSPLYSRLSVFVLFSAGVMLLIMCSHAARASPAIPIGQHGVKRSTLRRVKTPHSQSHLLSRGPLSTEKRFQTVAKSETETKGNFGGKPSVINRQSHAVQFSQGYGQSNKDNGQPQIRIMQRGEVRPTSSTFTVHSSRHGGGWQSRKNDYTLPRKEEQTGNSYHSYLTIKRKPSLNKNANSSHIWDHKYNQRFNNEKVLKSDFSEVDGDKAVGKSHYPLPVSTHINGNQNTATSNPRGHYSGFKETNKLPAGGAQSSSRGIQLVKVLRLTSQSAPYAASLFNPLDASVIKRQPSQEKLTSSNRDFNERLNPVSSREVLGHRNGQSYLFKDAPTGLSNAATLKLQQTSSGVQEHSRIPSHFKWLNARDTDDGRKQSYTKHQSNIRPTLHIAPQLPHHTSLHPASTEGKHLERFVPTSHAHSWDSRPITNEKLAPAARVSATTRESLRDYQPGHLTKGFYRLRGFRNPLQQPVNEPSGPSPAKPANSQQSSLDKRMDLSFKNSNPYPYLSQKYTFGQRGVLATTSEPATKHERMGNSPSSPVELNETQITTSSTSRLLDPGFKHIQHLLPESDANMDKKANQTRFKLYKGVFGLEGFATQPLEGAKTLTRGQETSAVSKPGFEPFKHRNLPTWLAKRMRTLQSHNQTNETHPGSGNISTVSQSKMSGHDFKSLSKTAGGNGSLPRLKTNEKISKKQTFQGFQSIKNTTANPRNRTHWKYPYIPSNIMSSSYLRSGHFKYVPRQTSGTSAVNKYKSVGEQVKLLKNFTSSIVRGKRVNPKTTHSKPLNRSSLTNVTGNAAIIRLPKRPARVKAVTYTDIVGSASFSSVQATNQTAITQTDEDRFQNVMMTTPEQKAGGTLKSDNGVNSSRSLDTTAENEGDFNTTVENKFGEEPSNEIQTLDLFFYKDGSGSGVLNLSDVLSTMTENWTSGKDVSELDYLQISTGNISFKSAEHLDQ